MNWEEEITKILPDFPMYLPSKQSSIRLVFEQGKQEGIRTVVEWIEKEGWFVQNHEININPQYNRVFIDASFQAFLKEQGVK